MEPRDIPRDGAVNRLLEDHVDERIEIEPEYPPSPGDLPRAAYHAHSRGPSENQNLLGARARGFSESHHLLTTPPMPTTSFTSAKGLRSFTLEVPETPKSRSSHGPIWVGMPQLLKRYKKEWWSLLLVDLFMFSIGIPFLVLIGYLIRFNGQPVTKHEQYILEQCLTGAATLLPLVFSLVIGRMMLKVASWKLEQGASLGLLEQLMGSRTLGGTLVVLFSLRSWQLISLGLIILWLFSPAGSQAALRVLYTTPAPAPGPYVTNLSYLNTRQASYAGTDKFISWFSAYASLFGAALFSPLAVKTSDMDLWGNVKIPIFSSLTDSLQSENGWKPIYKNSTVEFSSLFGIPLAGLQPGNTTFTIESSYMELSCINRTTILGRSNGLLFYPGEIIPYGIFESSQLVTSDTTWLIGYSGEDLTSLLPNSSISNIDSLPSSIKSKTSLPGTLIYQDFTGAFNVTSIYCNPSQTYVESEISCIQATNGSPVSCAVIAQRLSLLPHMPSSITSFSFQDIFLGTSASFPQSVVVHHHIDPIQNYIVNPSSTSYIQSTPYASLSANESRFATIPLEDFGTRLSQLLNTFLQGSTLNYSAYITDPASSFAASRRSHDSATPPSNISAQISTLSPLLSVTTNTTLPPPLPTPLIYALSLPYLIILIISVVALPLSALISALLTRLTIGRDYLGAVSSIVRESQYIDFPPGGTRLTGVERSRDLKNLRIRLGDMGDVRGGFEVGMGVSLDVGVLAVGAEGRAKGLSREKLYL